MRQTRRRQFLIATGALLAAPRIAGAQAQTRLPVLGILNPDLTPTPQELAASPIYAALRKLGWVEGQNLRIERADADGREERLPELAAELARKRVDVIYTLAGPGAAMAAARATKTIPIVFFLGGDPVANGLVDTLARPGRNATGIAYTHSGVILKEFELLKQLVPRLQRVASIIVPSLLRTVAGAYQSTDSTDKAVNSLGITLQHFPVEQSEDFDAAFKNILAWRAQGLRVLNVPLTFRERSRFVDFAADNRLPCISSSPRWVETGALASYGPTFDGLRQRAISMVDRILRGAKPSDIPVELPTRYELAINLKTARALKLKIPQVILARADRVIE